jgi:hypothetical protein
MRTIRVSDVVWNAIAERGRFGETEDDVLRRVFSIPAAHTSPFEIADSNGGKQGQATSARRRTNRAERRMRAIVEGDRLHVSFAGGGTREWALPTRTDKPEIRDVLYDALDFARKNRATEGQQNAVRKALTEAGYHLTK